MKFNALKGVEDILLPDIRIWQHIESEAREIFSVYGYSEIRFLLLSLPGYSQGASERQQTLSRRRCTPSRTGQETITLRPEGTASVVRSYVETIFITCRLLRNSSIPGLCSDTKGCRRAGSGSSIQIGVEAFGVAAPGDGCRSPLNAHEARQVGLTNLNLEINSIGCEECRPSYKKP